ncbi:hypothetical protein Afil01_66640 [Actinorhabdospora filicis]|uniref:Methyltransferase domain-containing protein n=1 Tax=Actinorhabdospora filicis TaxID=1785913 RepID=A0A9W6SU36_9ACTN|nr:class I SAM-dependent methyltransferase [Actinorhabdospora filicis]GLZ81857.1 hypothetical protein Afil01_66640 [Actinorhabdospora filicis]
MNGLPRFARVFGHQGVAEAYRHRPPYPDQVFAILGRLATAVPRTVLDLGAGEGALARPLASIVERVDAVDVSAAMIAVGRSRPGGDAPNLRWIHGPAETAGADGPYALATAGASLHWMDLAPLMARLDAVLAPGAQLAIVEHGARDAPWRERLDAVIERYSRNPDHDPAFSVVNVLGETFRRAGMAETRPVPFRQPVADFVEGLHSTSALAREHMDARESDAFGREVAEAVGPWIRDGVLDMTVTATVTWGVPATRAR